MSECENCGDANHIAKGERYCHACAQHVAERSAALRSPLAQGQKILRDFRAESPNVTLQLSYFEASLVLCVLAVAKSGHSKYESEDMPLRRSALERAYAKLSFRLGVDDAH